MFKVKSKDTRTKPIFLALIRLQTFSKELKWNIWTKIYCLLWTDFAMCPSVFIVDFEEVNAGCGAKERIVPDWNLLYTVNKTN